MVVVSLSHLWEVVGENVDVVEFVFGKLSHENLLDVTVVLVHGHGVAFARVAETPYTVAGGVGPVVTRLAWRSCAREHAMDELVLVRVGFSG